MWGFSPFDLTNFLFSSAGGEKIEMGGDDVLGRPLGGACVPTQLMLSDLKEASQDASLPQASRSSEEKEGGRGGGTRTENPLPIRSRRSQKKKNSTSFFFFLFQPRKKNQSIRKLALDLAASSAPSFEGLRAVYRALGVAKGLDQAPSLEEALSGGTKKKKKAEPETTTASGTGAEANAQEDTKSKQAKPRDPALAARLQALQDASDQASYDACVADLTEGERKAAGRSGHGLSLSLAASAPAAGLALAASAGTGYAAGFVAARALFPDEARHPAARYIGGLAGLVAALAVEAGLVVVRAVRAEREERRRMRGAPGAPFSSSSSSSSSNSSSLPLPKITRRLTEAELAAEAEVAAAVVAGAATAARAGAEARAAEAARAAELAAEKDSAATVAAVAADETKKQR